MGLFEKIFRPQAKKIALQRAGNVFQTLTAYAPVFTSFGGCIYESELVRAAIDSKARHISKLKVEIKGNPVIEKLMRRPNAYQTWTQFLYRLDNILEVHNTAFIVPIYDRYGQIVGIWPVLPFNTELLDYEGEPWIRYTFANGNTAAEEMSKCGILVTHQYRSDIYGESNAALLPTMDLIHIDNQGIQQAVRNSATFRFMAKSGNFADDEDLRDERRSFNEMNLKADIEASDAGGVLLFPHGWDEIKQIDSKPYTVDAKERKLIQDNVFNYFGTNEKALQNRLYGDEWAGFYEGAIEPFAIQCSEVLEHMLFSDRQLAQGSYVRLTANRLQYLSNAEKLKVSVQLADRGVLNRDDVREIWNLPPLPNGEGQAYIIRGEYYNADDKLNDDEVDDIDESYDPSKATQS